MSNFIDRIQRRLEFRHWGGNEQFTSEQGLGRVSLIACILSSILTAHVLILIAIILDAIGVINVGIHDSMYFSVDRVLMAIQWTLFAIFLCIFHLAEFFVTAFCNPTVLTASSYVVNHSKQYTIAILVRIFEGLFSKLDQYSLALFTLFALKIGCDWRVFLTIHMVSINQQ
mmetsp:Transcript_5856/g.11074  ORF Transcript_5856/g.11074 Transcript_5856/m.11074 type:complete len:171 (+) Transcript_5856:210-722(+)